MTGKLGISEEEKEELRIDDLENWESSVPINQTLKHGVVIKQMDRHHEVGHKNTKPNCTEIEVSFSDSAVVGW
ncbi:hypothetical protein V6N13_102152 [Hibiscus sabdariffa]